MSTVAVILILASVLICLFSACFWFMLRKRQRFACFLPTVSAPLRKLTTEERAAIKYYLDQHTKSLPRSQTKGLILTLQSDHVYAITHAITRYDLAGDEPDHGRYYLDSIEVHLPSFWEQHICADNHVEVIKTQTLPLVISLNGHSLLEHIYDNPLSILTTTSSLKPAFIRQEESEHVELLCVRQETQEEHALNRPNGIKEAVMTSIALLLLFFSLISSEILVPWLIFIATLLMVWSYWALFRSPTQGELKEVHCLRGIPKRWGLFAETHQGQVSNISLGIIDLSYPPYWQPYLGTDFGKTTQVDVYLDRQVIRQGSYLSLHDEVKNVPLQQWGKNAVLATGSLLVLLLLLAYLPLNLPAKLSSAWLHGTHKINAISVQMLEKTPLHIGDTLTIQGIGRCYIPSDHKAAKPALMPFDCSRIYWNTVTPVLPSVSTRIDQANALMTTLRDQLYSNGNAHKLNRQLASAIEKSGMILLDNFADIVLKTKALCSLATDCIRLKNALVNLGNAKNWATLVKRAKSGELQGVNVLLRPVSAGSLENLIRAASATYITSEIHRTTAELTALPKGGFLIISDENKQLVTHPLPTEPLNTLDPLEQWQELQRLSSILLSTPFQAHGVITNIVDDVNNTRHITLQSGSDKIARWHYLATSLLLLAVVLIFTYNTWHLIQRWRKSKRRLSEIQNYYQRCLNESYLSGATSTHQRE